MADLKFNNYIGIDYSGAKTSLSRLAQLQIYIADPDSDPRSINLLKGIKIDVEKNLLVVLKKYLSLKIKQLSV